MRSRKKTRTEKRIGSIDVDVDKVSTEFLSWSDSPTFRVSVPSRSSKTPGREGKVRSVLPGTETPGINGEKW